MLDDWLLLDAGTGVARLTLEEMAPLQHVLLTHSHMDHIAALFGGMALAAAVVAMLLKRWQAIVHHDSEDFLSSLAPALVISLGFALWFLSAFFLYAAGSDQANHLI